MLKSERKQIILSQLKQDGFVTLENLTVLLSDTSESTIRRDLDRVSGRMANLNVFMAVLKAFMV